MSGMSGPQRGLTRRSFLKTTAAAAGAAAVVGATPSLQAFGEEMTPGVKHTDGEQIFRGVCRPNCFAFCHLNVHVRRNNIVKTSRAPYNDSRYNRICHRGLSHVQRIYDPDRLKYPMRRTEGTERGAGEWTRITWDEAIAEIADNMKRIQAEYGVQAVSFLMGSGNQSLAVSNMYSRLQNTLHASLIAPCLDQASSYGMIRMGGPLTQMWECNEITDICNAKHIVTWGANLTDAQVQNWHFIKEAIDAGTTLWVVDPNFTQIAAKADRWIPIRPGTDMVMYMGLAKIFVERGAVDESWLNEHTVAPFLVNMETKQFMRASDTGFTPIHTGQMNPLTGQEVIIDPYLVLENGMPVTVDDAKAPELDAEFALGETKYRTVFSLLKDELAKFPIEFVSETTQVPVETINDLADLCLDGPVTHYVGYGPQAYSNGVHATHAGMIMNALIGNLGKPGASFGSYWHYFYYSNMAFTMPTGPNPTPNVAENDLVEVMRSGKHLGQDFPIKMMYVYSANPLCTFCETNLLLDEVWAKMDFIVTADSQMTDTARFSDLVLPIAQWFEVEDITNAGQTSTLSYNEKAIDPLYECKADTEIVKLIANEMGIGEYFDMSTEEILRGTLDSDVARMFYLTYDLIKMQGDMRFSADNPHIAWRDNSAYTNNTGRMEFYLENPTPRTASSKEITPELLDRERLPHWFPPSEAWHESEAAKKYPIHFMSERPRYRVHSQWFNVRALREIDPEPTVKINPIDAEARGIEDGTYVECYNDRGMGVGKAIISEAVRPGVVVYPKNWQMFQHKAGSWSELLNNDFDPFAVNGNFMDAMCEIRPWKEGGDK